MAWLTQQDVQDYGSDLIDLTQRSALQAVAPHLQSLEQQNHELQRRLAQEARESLDARVERAVPNYREIDRDPNWLSWLAGIDSLSGRQRQQLLNDAIASNDTNRVIGFFRQFQQRNRGAGQTSYRASSSNKPTYTRAQIQQLYNAHRRGAYNGREAGWNRIDADIVAAAREGRIRNPDIITK